MVGEMGRSSERIREIDEILSQRLHYHLCVLSFSIAREYH